MRRAIGLMLAALLLMGAVGSAGAYAKAEEVTYNEAYREEAMYSVKGERIELPGDDSCLGDKYTGLMFVPPDVWDGAMGGPGSVEMWMDDFSAAVDYVPEEYLKKMEQIAPEDDAGFNALLEEMAQNAGKVLCVYRVNQNRAESLQLEGYVQPLYAHIEAIGAFGDDHYYIAYNDKFDESKLSEGDKKNLAILTEGLAAVKEGLMLFPPAAPSDEPIDLSAESEPEDGDFAADLTSFTAKDLAGKEYTQAMFKDYDLTMVNVWTTWCGPCVGEMPELAELHKRLPKNVNMISICADADEDAELAQEILAFAKAEFTTLVPGDDLKKVIDSVYAYPTTFFVDGVGRLIEGDAAKLVGAPEDVLKDYAELIEKNLKAIGK